MTRWILSLLLVLGAYTSSLADTYISGFVEATQALRIQSNSVLDGGLGFQERGYPRSDLRAQLKLSGGGDRDEYFLRMDFVSDPTHTGENSVDLREAFVKLHPHSWLDLKIGRQIATWGTGDLLFANDLFAKDWVAFFTGMDLGYLKRPQDLLRIGLYAGGTTLEIAASPHYTMDHLPNGERLSIYNPFSAQTVNAQGAAPVQALPKDLKHAELFARVSGYMGGHEWALYGYRGFFPQPQGVIIVDSVPHLFAPRMSSLGASLRGSVGSYLVNLESALYYSEDDSDGRDATLPNSAVKLLAGVERNLGNELTASAQWFGDLMMHYDEYTAPFLNSGIDPLADELRHTVTLRLSKFLRYQTVRLNFFGYWGISDHDTYLRPSVDYDFTDAMKITLGANWLDGDQPHTMFGQFQNNSNVYGRIRYSF